MFPYLLVLALRIVLPAMEVEERRSIAGLPAHIAGSFEEMSACHLAPSGDYLIFDRRAHAVYSVPRGGDSSRKIVQIGAEAGRILRPSAFDSAADGTFVVADSPGVQQRIQFFLDSGTPVAGFRMPGPPVPQITLGNLTLSGIGSLQYTGHSVLVSQPETGALVTEYEVTGETRRSFGELRPTGQEKDPALHAALNTGLPLVNPSGGYYFVFVSGAPMFRKYDAAGKLVFERHIEGIQLDPYVRQMPTTWPRRRSGAAEYPVVPAMIRTAAVDREGNLWVSLISPYTYVYDVSGDKRSTVQFRGAGIVSPTSFFFTSGARVLITPGCYTFSAQ